MISAELLRKVRQIEIRTLRMVNDVFAGQYQSVFKGRGMEFHEVREYVPGDEIRSIDWNVTARAGVPHVKKYVEERQLTVMLAVDVSASQQFGSGGQLKQDLAAELAAVLAFAAIRNNDRVGLILFSEEVELFIPPAKGPRHVLRVIREVLSFEPQHRATAAVPALDFLNHVTAHNSVCFLISDFLFQDDYAAPLAISARRYDLVGLVVGDRREQHWPAAGVIRWIDPETGRSTLLDSSDRRVRKALEELSLRQRRDLLQTLRRKGVDPIEVYADEPYERELVRFFRMRERRAAL